MAWSSAVAMGVSNFFGGLQQYVSAQSQAAQAETNAEYALAYAQAQAQASKSQARIADVQAAQAQRQGEYEAEKRARVLAQDIGSVYANAAGNGLMVDGATNDTVGNVLTSVENEGRADIATIQDNSRMNIWTYTETAKAHRTNAANALTLGNMQYANYMDQASAAKASANQGLMQTISGVPASAWATAGVTSMSSFGKVWGGTLALPLGGGIAIGSGLAES